MEFIYVGASVSIIFINAVVCCCCWSIIKDCMSCIACVPVVVLSFVLTYPFADFVIQLSAFAPVYSNGGGVLANRFTDVRQIWYQLGGLQEQVENYQITIYEGTSPRKKKDVYDSSSKWCKMLKFLIIVQNPTKSFDTMKKGNNRRWSKWIPGHHDCM